MLPSNGDTASRTNGHHILVAEDDAAIVRLTAHMLKSAGFTVHSVPNGEEAVDYIRHGQPQTHLVIMDVEMPKMGGIEAVEHIRTINRDLPVVFSTGLGDKGVDALIESDRAITQIHKPYHLDQLVSCIRELLDSSHVPADSGP
jgi:CheY-like chemotaxis protein